VIMPIVRADWQEQRAMTRPTRGGFGATGS
jgi:dUTPase